MTAGAMTVVVVAHAVTSVEEEASAVANVEDPVVRGVPQAAPGVGRAAEAVSAADATGAVIGGRVLAHRGPVLLRAHP